MNHVYRFECDGVGIHTAVESSCPQNDHRRSSEPNTSWIPDHADRLPGAISFWKPRGRQIYEESGLMSWHCSVVKGELALIVAAMPKEVLYEDELQILCAPDTAQVVRVYKLEYAGPRPFSKPAEDRRPACVRHYQSLHAWCCFSAYPQSTETFSLYARMGAKLGLNRIAVNHEVLRPGTRSSWPHAHKIEEELVFVLEGTPDVWVNGRLYATKPGDLIYFPFATGYAHTVINNSHEETKLLVLGEQDKEEDWIYYPMHPERNAECKALGFLWEDEPQLPLGSHSGEPGEVAQRERGPWLWQKNIADIKRNICGGPDNSLKIYYHDCDLGKALGTQRIAFHHCVLPSGFRSSLPHAESHEEEFVYVLKGRPIAWINGHRHALQPGDGVAFPSGLAVAHTFINESGEDVELIVTGEKTKPENRCAFPLNPEEKEFSDIWWEDAPTFDLGSASPHPQ